MKIVHKVSEMEGLAESLKGQGRIVFVPTMGALHEGHLSLFREGKRRGGFLVTSIFVNPTQFNDPKDFDRYPRDLHTDLEKCLKEGVHFLFTPPADELYPEGLKAEIRASEVARNFEGVARPGHFNGVATVVAKLFRIVQPDVAIFGQKDYQQLLVIRELVKRLKLPIEIVSHPTVRTPERVAMSSRNALLSPDGYRAAQAIPRALEACHRLMTDGEASVPKLEGVLREELKKEPGLTIDYARVVDAETLRTIETVARPAVALVAVIVEGIRLIDNQPVNSIN